MNLSILEGKYLSKLRQIIIQIYNIKKLKDIFNQLDFRLDCGCPADHHGKICYWLVSDDLDNKDTVSLKSLSKVKMEYVSEQKEELAFDIGTSTEGIIVEGTPIESSERYEELISSKDSYNNQYNNSYDRYQPNIPLQKKIYGPCTLNGYKLEYLHHYVKSDSKGRSLSNYKLKFNHSDIKMLDDLDNLQNLRKLKGRKTWRRNNNLNFNILPKEMIYKITNFIILDIFDELNNIIGEIKCDHQKLKHINFLSKEHYEEVSEYSAPAWLEFPVTLGTRKKPNKDFFHLTI